MRRTTRRAFTLVEILIVVVILGILAAIVVPQFARAVQDSAETASFDQLAKVRRALSYYYATNSNQYPTIVAGNGTWGPLLPVYMRSAPENSWVGGAASKVIIIGNAADSGYQMTHGWIYEGPTTGNVWAGAFDANDRAYPRP